MNVLRAIGLMSGTSLDGVDVALIETDGVSIVRQGPHMSLPYADEDRALLRQALRDAAALSSRGERPGVLADCEAMVTQTHASTIERFLAAHHIDRDSIEIVGFHGQTVLHRPERRLSVQIGDGALLAETIAMPVASDFRAADVAAGGQGAPLVPIYHRALAIQAGLISPTVVLNVGGVANITYLNGAADPIACDTGPGNALLDDIMQARTGAAMDHDGATSARGKVDNSALAALLADPYFALIPPKSLDRNAFSLATVAHLTLEDAGATLIAFTAEAVAIALRQMPVAPRRVIVCGGGARNPTLMRALAARTACVVENGATHGWSVDAMEAQAFAYLAVRCQRGLPITFPTTTGAPRPLPGGRLSQPRLSPARKAG